MLITKHLLHRLALLVLATRWEGSVFGQQTIHVPQDSSTIQDGINAARSGDTVLVSPGTYNENIDFRGKAITLTSGAKSFTDTSTTSTIINGRTDGPVVNFSTNETAAAVLNGFTIQNGHSSIGSSLPSGGISISGASPTISNNVLTNNIGTGIVLSNTGGPLIQGNDIRNTIGTGNTNIPGGDGNGLVLKGSGSIRVIGNTIENNVVSNLANGAQTACGAGVNIGGENSQILFRSNTIRNNRSVCSNPGLFMTGMFSPPSLVLVQNLIYDNVSTATENNEGPVSAVQVYLGGSLQAPFPSVTEINNTIYGPGTAQEFVYSFGPSVVENNVFVNANYVANAPFAGANSGLWCADPQASSSPITLNNNDIFNVSQFQDGGCIIGSGNLSIDPEFLNVTNDFHTQPTSPVVAAGLITALDIPPSDLDAKARVVCGTIDMGVYEIRPHPPIILAAVPNPATSESSVTLTAIIAGNCNAPTGMIVFLDGTTVLGSAPLNGGADTTFSTSGLFVGTHDLTATYAGDFNFDNSISNTVKEVITGPPTATVLKSVYPNPAKALQPITMTASVSSAYTVPTGNVMFTAGEAVLATVPLNVNGIAAATVSTLTGGIYDITAVYGGSTQYGGSTSNSIPENVIGLDTTTSLSASPSSAAPGRTIIFTAQVLVAQLGLPLTGFVTFKDGTTTIGAANVGKDGVATFETGTLLTGTHNISASYNGTSNYSDSASGPVIVVITGIPTSVGLNASPNPSTAGQTVKLVATAISALPGQVPTGSMTFTDQSGVLGTVPVAAGVATLTTTSLSTGSHQITATLNPTGFFATGTSTPVTEVVNDFNFSLAISSTSLALPSGDYEVLTVTATPNGGFAEAVIFGCSSVPDHAQCVFKPQTSQPLSQGAQTVQLILNTSDVLGYGNKVGRMQRPRVDTDTRHNLLLSGMLFPLMPLCCLFGYLRRCSHTPRRRLLLSMLITGLCLNLQACDGKLPAKTPPGTYIITVTAADAGSVTSLARSIDLQLTITPR
ncbi:Ig-like domain repeat protein [Granulicella sp. dw_53]|uniref:Ig-like domain repeat protein n=1 Tax=Granulicella sp. dw_53 TaxID=2719792 RepID=UPI001BD4A3C9|nr:Ig-like domain repeat protein [Granulicella sp. dw_53]